MTMTNTSFSPRRHGGHGEARRMLASSVYLRVLRASVVKILFLGIVLGFALCNVSLQAEEELLVESVGMTVADMDRSIEFFSKVLSFEKVADVEVTGEDYERLQGVFGLRMRVVRMRLGDEFIELTEYLASKGRPVPVDSRSNDRWFQHIAIITSDMDKAYALLRQHKVEHASTGPQRLPDWNKNAAGISAFYFKDPDGHPLEVLQFPADKGADQWHRPSDKLFLGLDYPASVVAATDASVQGYPHLP